MALQVLSGRGIDAGHAKSRPWDEFAGRPFDAVLTVCDAAAGEACPWFSGPAARAHWGVPDPAAFDGDDEATLAFFEATCDRLERRVHALLELPLEALEPAALQQRLATIGQP